MSTKRLAAVICVTGFSLAGTLFLEAKTSFVSSFREKVGVTEYSLADAKRVVEEFSGNEGEIQVLLAYTGEAAGLAHYLPPALAGWDRNGNVEVTDGYLREFGRSLAEGLRPTADQIWPAGTMVMKEDGSVALDDARKAKIYGGSRDRAAALYENGIGKLLITLEKFPRAVAQEIEMADRGVSNHLDRESFEIDGREFLILTDPNSAHVLIRSYVNGEYVLDVRGSAYVGEIVEMLESVAFEDLQPTS